MRFGAHVSASEGLFNAGPNGKMLGCEIIQIFSRSPQGGKPKSISQADANIFKKTMKENDIHDVYIHAPYFINLASGSARIRHSSSTILREELERGTILGCKAMMFHPGSAKDVGRKKGIALVIAGLDEIMNGYRGTCQLLIEISAGAGEVMGDTFAEIAAFIKNAKRGQDIGVCFDTQHAFASGYDWRTKNGLDNMLNDFEKIIGLEKIKTIHCNDSKVKLGARKDRHEHLGKGKIGLEAFKNLVNHPKLKKIDLIIETPHDDEPDPRFNDMKLLKSWRKVG